MLHKHLKNHRIILASKSPRRIQLLGGLGISFEVMKKEVDETFPPELKGEEIALYLCRKKAEAYSEELRTGIILITADTIVWLNGKAINKPAGRNEAITMLKELSGKRHEVYTAVCIKSLKKQFVFSCRTDVYFKRLYLKEIEYYVDRFHPFDKAGSYGAQEFIGYIGIEKIDGSFYNVMGLPVKEVYEYLIKMVTVNQYSVIG